MAKPRSALSRRGMIIGGGALSMASDAKAKIQANPLRPDIEAFVRMGVHRAGTMGEKKTIGWIQERLVGLGFETAVTRFPIQTLMNPSGTLRSTGLKIPAFPQWLAPSRDWGEPITGPMAVLGDLATDRILVVAKPLPTGAYWTPTQQSMAEAAKAGGAKALVIAMQDPTDSIYACNQDSTIDLPLPVATVSPSALADLRERAETGTTATLRFSGRHTSAHASLILATKPGQGQAIIVSTPLTGWFQCGAERGPGVALMLALAETLTRSPQPVWLVATGAHELGHLGMKQALASGRLPTPADTALWLHLGAGISARALDGVYALKPVQVLTRSAGLSSVIGTGFGEWTANPASPQAPGEAGDVVSAGYDRVIGLAAGFPGFHTPGDDGRAVDYIKLDQVLEDLKAMISRI